MNQESTSALVSSRGKYVEYPKGGIRLRVINLHPDTTVEMLKEHFSKFGTVIDAYIPKLVGSDKIKDYGYIVMFQKDVKFGFFRQVINNQAVDVSEDFLVVPEKETILFVSSYAIGHDDLKKSDLKIFFSQFGAVESVTKIQSHREGPPFRPFAFIHFYSESSLENAIRKLFSAFILISFIALIFFTKTRESILRNQQSNSQGTKVQMGSTF